MGGWSKNRRFFDDLIYGRALYINEVNISIFMYPREILTPSFSNTVLFVFFHKYLYYKQHFYVRMYIHTNWYNNIAYNCIK